MKRSRDDPARNHPSEDIILSAYEDPARIRWQDLAEIAALEKMKPAKCSSPDRPDRSLGERTQRFLRRGYHGPVDG